MSVDLSEPLAGWDAVRNALGRIRAIHTEFEQFFSGVFEQLQSLSGKLAERQGRWESQRQEAEKRLQQRTITLEEKRAALSAQREQLEQTVDARRKEETAAAAEENRRLEQLLESVMHERTELCGVQETVQAQVAQLAAVAAELAEARHELNDTRDEIVRRRDQLEAGAAETAPPPPNKELQDQIDRMEREQIEWEQERRILELELETVRNRAAEMAELLADRKQQASSQKDQWADEFKRIRCLLEAISGRLADAEYAQDAARFEPLAAAAAEGATIANEDSALNSVMAQFEMLQKDLAKRRAATS